MTRMRALVEEHLGSSAHLSRKHVHPRLLRMFEMGGMNAVFTRAEGQYLWDADGRRHLDLLSGGGVHFIGRHHPRVREALRDILDLDLPNLPVVNASVLGGLLAERLLEVAGPPLSKVVFGSSGAEATEVCIRFARRATGRRRFLYLDGAFHGRTYGAISLCGFGEMKDGQDPLMPTCTPVPREDIRALERELRHGDVAALFVEGVQGMTCEALSAEYLRAARALCTTHGTAFVMDEVQTGLGRTGSWFACHDAGVEPDMLTVSKTLSGGEVPVSAVLMSDAIYDTVYAKFKAGPIYFSTFAENDLAMAAGLATLEVLEDIDAPARARALSARLRDGLAALAARHDVIDRVTGRGLIAGIVFKVSAGPALRVQQAVLRAADAGAFAAAVNVGLYRRGCIVQIPGPGLDAIKILPPVILSDEDVDTFLTALDDVIAEYRRPATGPAVALAQGIAGDAARTAGRALTRHVGRPSPGTGHGRPLGARPEGLREFADYRGPIEASCDVCVVGSGPAGAVLAHRLATAGRGVLLLEAGPVVRIPDYVKDAGETLVRYFWDGGARTTKGNVVMPTLQARCLGGGSVFNSAICMRAPDSVLRRWAEDDGVEGLAAEAMARHYDNVETFMGVRPVRPEVQGRRNELFRVGGEALGFRVEAIRRNEDGCRGSGECLTGCAAGAKSSLDRRGVPELLAAGGRVFTSVHAERLSIRRGRVVGVRGAVVEPATGRRTHPVAIRARCTVLAAGALASPLILQRSGHRHEGVGRNLRMHPGSVVIGRFPEEVRPWDGATQGYHVTGFIEEGIKLESVWATASLLAVALPGAGAAHRDAIARMRDMATWGVWVGGEDSVGRVRALPGGGKSIRYELGDADVARLKEGTARLVEMFFAAGATEVLPGLAGVTPGDGRSGTAERIRRASVGPRDLRAASNHVFGTTAMGGDPARHVTDSAGGVYGLADLYVCDTGLFPSSPLVNPMLTAMALGDRMGELLAERYA